MDLTGKMMPQSEKKTSFYPKFRTDLTSKGYEFWDEIRGKGLSHSSKPDYLALKNQTVVIGEIKSPVEGPLSPSWRVPQCGDSAEFAKVRLDVAKKEKCGALSRQVGGHEIIIRGQIPDYLSKIGRTYDLPWKIAGGAKFMGGYSSPLTETTNIEQAFTNCGIIPVDKIIGLMGTVTFIFKI
jgi:hypothetical protein